MYGFMKTYNKMLHEGKSSNPQIAPKDKQNKGTVDNKKKLGMAGTDVIEDDYIDYEKPKVSDKEKKNKGSKETGVPGEKKSAFVNESDDQEFIPHLTPKDAISWLKNWKGKVYIWFFAANEGMTIEIPKKNMIDALKSNGKATSINARGQKVTFSGPQ